MSVPGSQRPRGQKVPRFPVAPRVKGDAYMHWVKFVRPLKLMALVLTLMWPPENS